MKLQKLEMCNVHNEIVLNPAIYFYKLKSASGLRGFETLKEAWESEKILIRILEIF